VVLTVSEMNDRDLAAALQDRRLDSVLIPSYTMWPHTVALPIYRERLVATLPTGHPLARREMLDCASLRNETILVQGWDESQAQREFFAAFLGSGSKFHAHGASKDTIFALVSAGFGITLAAESQSDAIFPGVVIRPIDEPTAWLQSISPGFRRPRNVRSAGSSPSCVTKRAQDDFSEVDGVFRNLANALSVAMKRASIGPTSFAGSTAPWPVSRASAWP
jgi:DNA-binding transcriptional LysR family regulator